MFRILKKLLKFPFSLLGIIAVAHLLSNALVYAWPTYEDEKDRIQKLATAINNKQEAITECVQCLTEIKEMPLDLLMLYLPKAEKTFLNSGLFSRDIANIGTLFEPQIRQMFAQELSDVFGTLISILKAFLVYDRSWSTYTGPEERVAPKGSYECYLLGVRLYTRAFANRRGELKVRKTSKSETKLPPLEQSLIPIAEEILAVSSLEFHPKLQGVLAKFETQNTALIKDDITKRKTSSYLDSLKILIDLLVLPPQLKEFRNDNSFKNAYDMAYTVESLMREKFFSVLSQDSKTVLKEGKTVQDYEKLLELLMKNYETFCRSDLEEKAKQWERENLQPMPETEFSQAVAAILADEPDSLDGGEK